MKRLLVISIIGMLLMTSLPDVTSQNNKTDVLKVISTVETPIKTVTIYRYNPDGNITHFQMKIEIKEEKTIEEILADKCKELLESDEEIQNYINNVIKKDRSSSLLTFIISYGRGIHFKANIKIREVFPKSENPSQLIPWVFCRYSFDSKAETTIIPLFKVNKTKNIQGPHRIFCLGFIGYTCWLGHGSILGHFTRLGLAGFSLYNAVKIL